MVEGSRCFVLVYFCLNDCVDAEFFLEESVLCLQLIVVFEELIDLCIFALERLRGFKLILLVLRFEFVVLDGLLLVLLLQLLVIALHQSQLLFVALRLHLE